jgi:D-arabinose 1-dehydrogenase-like Zn-dependent alcohol dehydrogenase
VVRKMLFSAVLMDTEALDESPPTLTDAENVLGHEFTGEVVDVGKEMRWRAWLLTGGTSARARATH